MSKPKGKKIKGGKNKETESDTKEGALAFKVLTNAQTKELEELNVEEMQIKLADIFNLKTYSSNLKEAAELDYYTGALWWGAEQGFKGQELSGFFTLIHSLFENVKEKQMSLVDNLRELKKMLMGIGMEGQATNYGGLEFFDTQKAKAITDYVYSSFFQHYKLYQFMFSCSQEEEIIGTDLDVEVAQAADVPFPPPLDEGLAEEIYMRYVATPEPEPTPEPLEDLEKKEEIDEETAENILAQLSPQDVKEIIESVAAEMLEPLQTDVAAKLREKENQLIARINKIHRVASSR
ncbi:ciliary-associated calcium-binding coiled-coil protein 1-like isoform X2 [Gigantopelta aegis]|uniref:ciliary-associated calcium-binding coiled-coil protein 1-like isoform X2 n=1 Tax=Gigantopelta aegis TaxID=1735272 RepID=UPI001B88D33D|nr:ciliary-associated calcium-binding coiled-coil protein 1-like isoform X2 [Gigantopelta aegis]